MDSIPSAPVNNKHNDTQTPDGIIHIMQFNDFQNQAINSIAIKDKSIAALAHRTLGLSGEAGIISDAMKKVIRDKGGELSDEDVNLLAEKIGDVLYYSAVLAEYAGLSFEDIANQQLHKSAEFLKSRQN